MGDLQHSLGNNRVNRMLNPQFGKDPSLQNAELANNTSTGREIRISSPAQPPVSEPTPAPKVVVTRDRAQEAQASRGTGTNAAWAGSGAAASAPGSAVF
jgi:hypothetical protein